MKINPSEVLSLDEIESLLSESRLELDRESKRRLDQGAQIVRRLALSESAIYGVNTGFGRLAQVRISAPELVLLQENIIRSHASGIGEPIAGRCLRRLLVLRALSLGKGASGISAALVARHLEYFNRSLDPYVPELGSVGASGDLAPLAHLALTFLGKGYFVENHKKMPAAAILKRYRLAPLQVGPKEGLALVNGTQFSLALALESFIEIKRIIPWMEIVAALSLEAHRGSAGVFDSRLHSLKMHPDQQEVARRFRNLLKGSPHMKSHRDCDLVQDAYSFRCIPQVLGPAYSILRKAEELLQDEANSVSDNPVLWLPTEDLISGGHFHAQAVSMAADLIALSATTLANLSERRMDQLINPLTTRGNAFLADRPGVESGLMILQTAAAALASENKTLVHPASADSIPTNGNQEDHVSMAPWAGRKAQMLVRNLRRIIAAELICATRGALQESNRTGLTFSAPLNAFLRRLAKEVPSLFKPGDREFGEDWQKVDLLMDESL